MKRLSLLAMAFAILFAVFFIAPPFLNKQFGLYTLMKVGDLIDVFTPLVLIPMYWLLFRLDAGKFPGLKANLIFILIAAFWIEGQGMHLAANSIGHLLKGLEGSDVFNLTNFYDEVLGHYLWHFGIFGLSALVIFRQWQNPFNKEQAVSWLLILAGIIHGFTLFIIVIEARTAPLGVTFAIVVALLGLILGRNRFSQRPMLLFFFVACIVATALFFSWGIYWHGLPEFSAVGIID
jgi:hypothetical protein